MLILHILVGLVVLDWPTLKISCLNPPSANFGEKVHTDMCVRFK